MKKSLTIIAVLTFSISCSLLHPLINKSHNADKPGSGGEAEVFALWDEQAPWPSLDKRQRPEGAVDVLVHRATEEYQFLHENAVVWHGNTLFAAWYNSPLHEIQGSASVRGRRSRDGGKTWSEVEVIAADNEGKGIFYVPVAFLSHGGTLYAYITTMVGHDLVVNCEVFVLDEATDQWESRGVIADMFQPHCTPVLMEDGNYIMAGRASISPGTFGEWPAVAISDGTNITDPWTVIRLTEDRLRRFPEPTVWVDGKNITAITRSNPDQPPQPSSNVVGRVFSSSDYGRNWRGPILHNLPELANSKLYAGMLSSGQRYLVWTTPSGGYRNELVIAVSRQGEEQLAAVWQLQHGRSEELGVGPEWSYPYAVEHDGKLYVIYTSQKNHSVMTIIPVKSLELTPFMIGHHNCRPRRQGNPVLFPETELEMGNEGLPVACPKDGGIWWYPADQLFKMWGAAMLPGLVSEAFSPPT